MRNHYAITQTCCIVLLCVVSAIVAGTSRVIAGERLKLNCEAWGVSMSGVYQNGEQVTLRPYTYGELGIYGAAGSGHLADARSTNSANIDPQGNISVSWQSPDGTFTETVNCGYRPPDSHEPSNIPLVPNKVEVVSPNGDVVMDTQPPRFTWQTVPGASSYLIRAINTVGQEALFFGSAAVGNRDCQNTCAYSPDNPLPSGKYLWQAKALLARSNGDATFTHWSQPGFFYVAGADYPTGVLCTEYELQFGDHGGQSVPLAPKYLDLNGDGKLNALDFSIGAKRCLGPGSVSSQANASNACSNPESMSPMVFRTTYEIAAGCQTRRFPISIGSVGPIMIDIQTRSGKGWQFRMDLRDGSGAVVKTARSSVDSRGILTADAQIGTYTLEVVPLDNQGAYGIALWSGYNVLSFKWSQSAYMDVSHWKYYLTEGGTYSIVVHRIGGNLEFNLRVADSNGNALASGSSVNGSINVQVNSGTGWFDVWIDMKPGTQGSYSAGLVSGPAPAPVVAVQPTAPPPPTPVPSDRGGDEVACPGYMPSRLAIGMQARVTPGDPNTLRSKPAKGSEDSSSKNLGQIPPGAVVRIVEGAVCNGNILWWKVDYQGAIGWTGEGQGNQYWLEPATSSAPSQPGRSIPPGNARDYPPAGSVRLGEFQVEWYCTNRGYGVTLVNNQRDWACTKDNAISFVLQAADFDAICQKTYNNPQAFAIRDQHKDVLAYNWNCYVYP